MMRAWLSRVAGLFAGASAAGLLSSFCGELGFPFWRILLPITFGNWLLAGALAALLALLSCARGLRERLGGATLWFAVGLGAGLIPVPVQLGLPAPAGYYAGGALAAALAYACWRFAWRAPTPVFAAIVALAPAWSLATGFYHTARLRDALTEQAESRLTLPERGGSGPDSAVQLGPPPPAGAPDVFLVSMDTLRADALAGPRPPGFELPFLDAQRADGTSWEYGLSSSNQTVPGHAGMLLGRDAMGTGVRWNRDSLPGPEWGPLLAERFLAGGWRTAAVISNDLLSSAGGFGRGFEIYDDTTVARLSALGRPLDYLERNAWIGLLLDRRAVGKFLTATLYRAATRAYRRLGEAGLLSRGKVTSDQALAALERLYAQDRPFFAFLHYMDPHQPYGAPPPYAGRLTAGLPPHAARYRPTALQGMYALDEIDRAARDLASDDPRVREEAELALRWFHLTYLEKLMFMDAEIRRVHERATASGRPSVWLFTSDHGEHFGEHGIVLHGNSLYEELVRVPFFLSGRGVPAGVAAPGTPRLEDVAPTLLALAGMEPPRDLHGRALIGEGAAGDGTPHVAADNKRVAARRDGWKLHAVWRSGGEADPRRLFRLADDPAEARELPLAGLPEALAAALDEFLARDLYLTRKADLPDFALQQTLDALGYAAGLAEQE